MVKSATGKFSELNSAELLEGKNERKQISKFPNSKIPKYINMSKKTDFVKSIHGMNEQDLRARLEEDKQRLKKLEFAHTISPLENPMTIR